jgi:hypothetical protein
MVMSPTLKTDLTELTENLDDLNGSGIDLEGCIQSLAATGALSVTSLAGFSVTVFVDDQAVTVTSMTGATSREIAASIEFPLDHLPTDTRQTKGFAVLYAHTAGAFVDLAADLAAAMGSHEDRIKLDANLADAPQSKIVGARELSTINRALGFLMAGGITTETAMIELQRQAATSHTSIHQTAEEILGETPSRCRTEVCRIQPGRQEHPLLP